MVPVAHPPTLTVLTEVRETVTLFQPTLRLLVHLLPSCLPGDLGLCQSSPAHVHIQPGGQRPVTGHLVCPLPAFVWPSAYQLWGCLAGGRMGGCFACDPGLPLLAALFIPPGTSKAPPTTGSDIPSESPEAALLLCCKNKTRSGHSSAQHPPLSSFLTCRSRSITMGHEAYPIWSLAPWLLLKYAKHTPAPGPLYLLFLPQYLHDWFPHLLHVFAEMSLSLTLLFKIIASVLHFSYLLFPSFALLSTCYCVAYYSFYLSVSPR